MAELVYPEVSHHTPHGPVGAYQTYRITQPSDRLVVAACHEVGCERWRRGWESPIDERTTTGQLQAWAIRSESGRTFTERRTSDGRTVFRFASGQRCFENHKTRPQIFRVRPGDFRGSAGDERVHVSGRDWVEDMQENQGRLIEMREQG